MPRSTKSKRANLVTAKEKDEETVTTTEVRDDLSFTIDIRPTPPELVPTRVAAGRKRIPSPWETILPGLKGAGWQDQRHDGKVTPYETTEDGTKLYNRTTSVKGSNAHEIIRELDKAVKYLNTPAGGKLNLGLGIFVTEEFVQFIIRDKQNRKPRNSGEGGEDVLEDEDEDFELEDEDDEDNGDE